MRFYSHILVLNGIYIVMRRDRQSAHNRIMQDYFVEKPLYTEELFRRRFRMSSRLFNFILRSLEEGTDYFKHKRDCSGRLGVSPLQKAVAALRMLAYGEGGDRQDEYVKVSERTAHHCRKRFCEGIVRLFKEKYLRSPTAQDVDNILQVNSARGFPGMIGMLLCCSTVDVIRILI